MPAIPSSSRNCASDPQLRGSTISDGACLSTRRNRLSKVSLVLAMVGAIASLLSPTAANAHGTLCQITPNNYAYGGALPVGHQISVTWGGKVTCFSSTMNWINFYGNLYAPGGQFIDSFTYTQYGLSSTEQLQTDYYQCKKKSPFRNEGSVTFTVELGYNAERADGFFDWDERTYSVTGSCPLLRH
jgi:hypothetical protein